MGCDTLLISLSVLTVKPCWWHNCTFGRKRKEKPWWIWAICDLPLVSARKAEHFLYIKSHTVQCLFQASCLDAKPVKDRLHSDSNYVKASESTWSSSIQTSVLPISVEVMHIHGFISLHQNYFKNYRTRLLLCEVLSLYCRLGWLSPQEAKEVFLLYNRECQCCLFIHTLLYAMTRILFGHTRCVCSASTCIQLSALSRTEPTDNQTWWLSPIFSFLPQYTSVLPRFMFILCRYSKFIKERVMDCSRIPFLPPLSPLPILLPTRPPAYSPFHPHIYRILCYSSRKLRLLSPVESQGGDPYLTLSISLLLKHFASQEAGGKMHQLNV